MVVPCRSVALLQPRLLQGRDYTCTYLHMYGQGSCFLLVLLVFSNCRCPDTCIPKQP